MSKSLGIILKKLRKEQRVGQKDLARGICSVSTLSRIEGGIKEPEQLLFDYLITRLGKDSTKWELILTEPDKKLFEKRNYMEYLIQTKQWEALEIEVEQYEHMQEKSTCLDEQYCCLIRTILYGQKKNYKKALQKGIEGLEKTEFYMEEKHFKLHVAVSRNELRLLYLIGKYWFQEEEKTTLFLYQYWNELFTYVEERCTDKRYRLEFYIEALYYLAAIFYKEGKFEESISYCKEALQELIEKKSSYYLKEFLLLVKELEHSYDTSSLASILSIKNIDHLLETLEFWEQESIKFQEKQQYIRAYNGTYSINEVIKHTRHYRGKTQEDIIGSMNGIDMIGNQSGISKIENGKRTPRKGNGKHYLESVGLCEKKTDYYQLSIRGEDFEIQELRWEIDFYIGIREIDEAEKLLWELKKRIDLDDPYNKQYIGEIELLIKYIIKPLPCEEYVKEIFELLSLTIDNVEQFKEEGEISCFLTREELILLMNVGCSYHQSGNYRIALKYYKKLEAYFSDFYQMAGASIYKTLLHNLSQVYGLLGEYEQSMEKSRGSIFLEMLYNNVERLYPALYNIGWCFGKMMIQEKDHRKWEQHQLQCARYFRQSFYLADLFRDENVLFFIQEKNILWNLEEIFT